MVAFGRHMLKSPTMQKMQFGFVAALWVILIGATFFFPADELSRSTILLVAVVVALITSAMFIFLFPPFMDRMLRLHFKRGFHKGVLGWHEIEIDEAGLIE